MLWQYFSHEIPCQCILAAHRTDGPPLHNCICQYGQIYCYFHLFLAPFLCRGSGHVGVERYDVVHVAV